jgi:hypothetical protein
VIDIEALNLHDISQISAAAQFVAINDIVSGRHGMDDELANGNGLTIR